MLDKLDERLLNLMREGKGVKPRLTELSRLVGENRSTVNLRVSKLEGKGVIVGYKSQVDHKKLGYKLTGYVGVICPHESIKELVERLKKEKAVCGIWEILAGSFDVLVKCRLREYEEIRKLHDVITEIEGVKDVDIWLLGPCHKEE
jgi:DNA-binding Lrp family transcriptional regulator